LQASRGRGKGTETHFWEIRQGKGLTTTPYVNGARSRSRSNFLERTPEREQCNRALKSRFREKIQRNNLEPGGGRWPSRGRSEVGRQKRRKRGGRGTFQRTFVGIVRRVKGGLDRGGSRGVESSTDDTENRWSPGEEMEWCAALGLIERRSALYNNNNIRKLLWGKGPLHSYDQNFAWAPRKRNSSPST